MRVRNPGLMWNQPVNRLMMFYVCVCMNVWELGVLMCQERKNSRIFSTLEKQKGGGCRQVKGERCVREFYSCKGWILEIILVLPSHCCRFKVKQGNILKYKCFSQYVRLLGNFY